MAKYCEATSRSGKEMKFLLVGGFAESLIRFRGPLIDALRQKGAEVHVAAPYLSENEGVKRYFVERGVAIHDIYMKRTGTNPISDLRTLFSIFLVALTVKPKYFLGYTIKPVIYGSIAARLLGVPKRFALVTGLGHAFQENQSRGWLKSVVEGLYRLALKRVDAVFFQNPDDELLFKKLRILEQDSRTCVVSGSGVDLSFYNASPAPRDGIRFLLIARLLGEKGVRLYAAAAKEIKKTYPFARFMLVGWLDDNPDAVRKEELDGWVAEGSIEYLGKLDDVRPAIIDCSVFVLPSFYREGTPRTILEALAVGRAVITTDAPGCRETVVEGRNGFLIPVRSEVALRDAMLRFIEDPSLISKMGCFSRELAESRYDVRLVNAEMICEMGL